jgi:hypothetical protein
MELGEQIGSPQTPRVEAGAAAEEGIQGFIHELGEEFNLAVQEPSNALRVAARFADSFVVVNPNGVMSWKNDARLPIVEGFEFYRRIGVRRASIRQLAVASLDEMHSQAKVCTEMVLRRAGGAEELVRFEVIYFLQCTGGIYKIFCMISDDEWRVWRERGLLPSSGLSL